MENTRLSVVALALSTLVAGHALAADPVPGKTREQVRAEVVQAQRSGDLIANGESGLRLNQLYPEQYAAQPATVAKSRSQVQGELQDARDNGSLIADGQTGATHRELAPQRYVQGKTREEVRAEVGEARRTGSLRAIDENYPVRVN